MSPNGITVHNTANDASAMAEVSYMLSNNNQVSYHFAVDDERAVQGIETYRNAWHAGDGGNGKGNRETISIEICYSKSGGEKFKKAEENAAYLIAYLLKANDWDISCVKKHQDWSGKYCPHRTLDDGWQRFLNMVKEYLDGSYISGGLLSTTPTNPAKIYRIRTAWTDVSSQIGAYTVLDNAKSACKEGYSVYDESGTAVFTVPKKAPVNAMPAILTASMCYKVYANGKWWPEVVDLNDYAGISWAPIKAIAVKATHGTVEYRVHVKPAGKWYPMVTGYDVNDFNNGYAGDCKNDIDAVEIYFKTPDGYVYRQAKYRVAPVNGEYFSWQLDRQTSNGQDGYAGKFGTPIGKLQITLQ